MPIQISGGRLKAVKHRGVAFTDNYEWKIVPGASTLATILIPSQSSFSIKQDTDLIPVAARSRIQAMPIAGGFRQC
jgi:hypothetical protein